MEPRKNPNFNFGGWNFYYIIPQSNQSPAESEQDAATNRIIEATLSGMEEFPDVKKLLDRIAGV